MPRIFRVIKNITIVIAVCTIALLIASLFFEKVTDYTEAEHLKRVTDLAKKRYLKAGSKYTDLAVYPLYMENDELGYFLIELEPCGFVYVELNCASKMNHFGSSMYVYTDETISRPWARYKVSIGNDVIYTYGNNGKLEFKNRQWTELDESGNPIKYETSHFKVANIKNEKMYLLQKRGYIPAVKRNELYLNLISMEYMDLDDLDLDSDIKNLVTADFINFIHEPSFAL